MSDTDLELLARYTRQHSSRRNPMEAGAEDAFAELVRRHLGLVYSAALRQVRSPQLAEEVAQSAFVDLARSAAKLKPDTILTAWLYQVTRRTAIDVVRREASRQLREQIATEMNAMNATAADWAHIEPLLDEAMYALDDTDRTAVLLRYFENKSLREVGATLGTSENAAQKRLGRAVEHLREFFAKRGVTVGASGLVVLISANGVLTAPAGLSLAIVTAVARITVVPTLLATYLALFRSEKRQTSVRVGLMALVAVMIGWRFHRDSSGRETPSAHAKRSSEAAPPATATTDRRPTLFGNSRRPGEAVVGVPDAMANPLPAIFRDWQTRQERAPVIRYHLAGKRVWLRGSFAPDPTAPEDPPPEDNPAQDVVGSCRRITLFDFPRNRFRVEFDNEEYDNLHRQPYRVRCLEVGDGAALRVNVFENSFPRPGDNRAKTHVDFWIATGDPQLIPPGIFGYGYEPLFFAAGIVPAKDVRIRPTALVPTNDLAAFSCEDRRSEDNTQYTILREGNKEYWVDLERDSAIVKMILKEQAAPRVVFEIAYQQTSGGWLPRGWTRTEFVRGKVVNAERVEVERVDVLPPVSDQDFVLEATPGMYVKDQRYFLDTQSKQLKSDSAHYRLESDGRKTKLNESLEPLDVVRP